MVLASLRIRREINGRTDGALVNVPKMNSTNSDSLKCNTLSPSLAHRASTFTDTPTNFHRVYDSQASDKRTHFANETSTQPG